MRSRRSLRALVLCPIKASAHLWSRLWFRGASGQKRLIRCRQESLIDALETRVLFSGAPAEAPQEEPAETTESEPISAGEVNQPGSAGDQTGVAQAGPAVSGQTPVTLAATTPLNAETLGAIASAARQRWFLSGISAEQVAALDAVSYEIADLGGGHLGRASGFTVTIDDDAAGTGRWFVDATPLADEEFFGGLALAGTNAAGRYDLLSALLHEQGHVLGLPDLLGNGGSLMNGLLSHGVRRLPGDYQALGAAPGSVVADEFLDPAWSQKGADLEGEAAGDQSSPFNRSVALSADGNTVVVGASGNDSSGSLAGHVRVYVWSGSAWIQRGSDLDGEAAGDQAGWSVALSSDGNILAIGATGNDGNGFDSGHVRVYVWNGSTWTQRGSDLNGEAALDVSGQSVALSSDGNILAIGATGNDGKGSNSGHVRVYFWNGSTWIQRGSDLDGEAAGDRSGGTVALSADGSTLAIGAYANDGNGDIAGHVRVYFWNGSTWTQRGTDLDGEAVGDQSGFSVALSADGNTLAIGAPGNDGNGSSSGHVRVFAWNSSAWIQQNSDLSGEAPNDESGRSVALSSSGNALAIGAPGNDGNGSDSGHVRVFHFLSANEKPENVPYADGFDYPIGDRGRASGIVNVDGVPEGITRNGQEWEKNSLYTDKETATVSRGGTTGSWYNISDVGNFVGSDDIDVPGYHLGEDWNFGGAGDDIGKNVYAVANGIVTGMHATNSGQGVNAQGWTVEIRHWLSATSFVDSVYSHIGGNRPDYMDGEFGGSEDGVDGKKHPTDGFTYGVGSIIKRGDVIGKIGAITEFGSHLHFELWEMGVKDVGRVGYYTGNGTSYNAAEAYAVLQGKGLVDGSDFIDKNRPGLLGNGSFSYLSIEATGSLGGDDTFTVRIDGSELVVSEGASESRKLLSEIGGEILIKGGSGSDSVVLDLSGGAINRPITFDGGEHEDGENDVIEIRGGTYESCQLVFSNSSDGNIELSGVGLITYIGLEPVDLTGTTITNLVINLTGGNDTTDFRVSAGNLIIDSLTGTHEDATVSLNGVASITVNGSGGDDMLTWSAVDASLDASLTINGGVGDDTIHLNGDITFAAGKFLDVDLQNDDGNPGVDVVNFGANANLILSGTGTAMVRASGNVVFASGSSLETADGNLTVEANQQAAATSGSFVGVNIDGGLIQVTGMGSATVKGRGGDGAGGGQNGVYVRNGGDISGGISGLLMIQGSGGMNSGSFNYGVFVAGDGSTINSKGADIHIAGKGGGVGVSRDNYGIVASFGGEVRAVGGGDITIAGQGGNGLGSGSGNVGVYILGSGTMIASEDGQLVVTGTGSGSLDSSYQVGVRIEAGGKIAAEGIGDLSVEGQAGNNQGLDSSLNAGVVVTGSGSSITSNGGNISVTGTGGGGGGGTGIWRFAIPCGIQNADGSGSGRFEAGSRPPAIQ